ncbi:MAG TPA: hemolysin III family protein [Candidatus Polarisedimenticolaceae bacterium]|nr:hemolysin III family protein [Candidatus Polarisedimenticolaceae bacterium]
MNAVKPNDVRVRLQSLGEEIANSISHGIGLIAAVGAAPVLIATGGRHGGLALLVGSTIFAATILVMYFSSTLYHALPHGRWKKVFEVLDHVGIFLLIAGTYTAFSLGPLNGAWGWTLFGVIWGLAVIGIVLKSVGRLWRPGLSTPLYVVMGWTVLIAIKPLCRSLPHASLVWLFAGGIAYTAGVAFYASRNLKYAHFVWHLFVVAGTTCHVLALLACAE